MDNIKNLISQSNVRTENNAKYLTEAFRLLNGLILQRNTNETIESATEMCVILAESCTKHNLKSVANDCVRLFFSLDPPENQYLARAYITQAQLIQPSRIDDINTLEKPVGFILKAIVFSKKEKRFHYLVHNSSLVYFEIVRNFLRPSYYVYLCKSLNQVCKALEEVNDSNMEWRSQLMLLLLQAHVDSGHRKEVIQMVDGTATFIGKHAPYLLKELLNLLINNGIGTNEKYLWYTKNNPPMQIYIRICRLRLMKEKDLENSYQSESKKIFTGLIGAEDTSTTSPAEEGQAKGSSSIQFTSRKLTNQQRCSLLLELAKVCLQKFVFDIGRQCVEKTKQMATEEMSAVLQEADLINAELVVMELESASDRMTTSSLKIRMTTMEKCALTLQSVIRSGNNKLIELGCVTLWNLCLPMLQPSLRDKISSHLIIIADTLESIGSLNYKFSCQVHIEVGKFYAASEQAGDSISYFKKAQSLDKTGEYMEMIDHFINKIKMQEKLYEKPEDPCDLARQLIEQVQSTLKIAKISLPELRPLLAQIGHFIAPEDFLVLLDHDLSIETAALESNVQCKATKTAAWEGIVTRLNSYLKRSGNINDRVKMNLWGDLVKLSRATQLWDICRVASCFAVLYDDGRWKNNFQLKVEITSRKGNRPAAANQSQLSDNVSPLTDQTNQESDGTVSDNGDIKTRKREESDLSSYPLIGRGNRLEKMLVETIADVYTIRAEAFMQAIRNEGAQLFTYPERPRDFKKHPKGYVKDTTKEDGDWKTYCECLQRMSESVVNCFLRSAALSVELQAPWLLQNSATYLWNYCIHVISLSDHGVLVPSFQTMFDLMRTMVNERMVGIVIQYGVILAHGLIQKYIPMSPMTLNDIFEMPNSGSPVDKKAKKGKESPKLKSVGLATSQTQAESVAQCKKALDICQYLMDITMDVAPISTSDNSVQASTGQGATSKPVPLGKPSIETKCRLIEMWVQCKQMLQQPIGPGLGTDDKDNRSGQRTLVRAITAVQMLWIGHNDLYKFSDAPNIDECILMIEGAEWSRSDVVVPLLMKLCFVAMNSGATNYDSVVTKLAETAHKYCSVKGKEEENLALSYITYCQAISLHKGCSQHSSVLTQCLRMLVKSCCYARDARCYSLVSQISHFFWRIAQKLIVRSASCRHITKEIESILQCISATVDSRRFKLFFESHSEEELPRIEFELEEKLPYNLQCPDDQKMISMDHCRALFQSCYSRSMSKASLEQDLVLRIQMYIAVFQSYFIQEKWTDALKVLDVAISDLPRTNHRLDLFRHRLLIKVRLGQSIELDIQKFKNEPECELSVLWREVAIWSKSLDSQFNAYQASIDVLKLRENDWLKAELVKEMSQWMLHHNYPVDVCDQFLEWAIDILLNIECDTKKPSKQNSATKQKPTSGSSKKTALKIDIRVEDVDEGASMSAREGEVGVTDGKRIIHGVIMQDTCPKSINDIADVRQLSMLFIYFVYRASIVSTSDPRSKECLVMANACISRMWAVSMKNVVAVVKEISKAKSEIESPGKAKDKKDKNIKIEPEQIKSKVIKRKGPVDWIPTNYEDWASFEVSDEVLEALMSRTHMPKLGINDSSIKNMGEFVASCHTLVDMLEDEGYELLTFPVLALLDLVSRSSDGIPAKVMNQYVHLRSLKIALRLNIVSACSHHEKFIDSPIMLPESLSYTALLGSSIKEYREDHLLQEKSSKFPTSFDVSAMTYLDVPHLSRKYTAFGYIHETWTKIGDHLIGLGYNKEAAEVLREAQRLSELLQDDKMLVQISIQRVRLFLNQGEIESAVAILDAVEENFSIFSLKQWTEIVALLLQVSEDDSHEAKEVEMLRTRLSRLKEHSENRLTVMSLDNRRAEVELLLADIGFSVLLTEIHLVELELTHDDINALKRTDIIRSLLSFIARIDKLASCYQNLTNVAGLVKVLRAKVKIYDIVLTLLDNEKSKIVILKKLRTVEELVRIELIKHDDIHETCSESQSRSCSLVIDRKLARAKLLLIDCLLTIYSMTVEKKVKLTLEHRKKNPLKQIVDEYVSDCLADDELLDWRESVCGVSDRLLAKLGAAHSLCRNIPDINAQVLSRYGHLMKLRAMEIHPTDDEQWTYLPNDDLPKPSPDVLESNGNREDVADSELSALEYRRKVLGAQTKMDIVESQGYLAQATEMLTQAINLSINCQLYDISCYSIELLVDILGQYETHTSVQLLCLYQSCRASVQLRARLVRTLREASLGQLAALVLQHRYLEQRTYVNEENLICSSLYRSVTESLNGSFSAWKVTQVSLNQTDLLKDLSGICTGICIIQHSSDFNYVYAAFIDGKQKTNSTVKQGKKQTSDKSVICRMRTSPQNTQSLVKTWNSFKIETDNVLYDIERTRSMNIQKTKLYSEMGNEKEIQRSLVDKDQLEADIGERILELERTFTDLSTQLSEYLSPLFEPFLHKLPSNASRAGSGIPKTGTQSNISKDCLVLLVDDIVTGTSIESVKYLKCPLSRDFSLQVLHHRYKGFDKHDADQLQSTDSNKKKDKLKVPHRIPALRDVNKKSTKVLPLNRQISAASLSLDTHQIRYFVDPHCDTTALTEQSLCATFTRELVINSLRELQVTPRWIGLSGEDTCPSIEEMELYMKDALSFVYVNTENLVSLMTPQKIAMLNNPDLILVCCIDRIKSRPSKDRLSRCLRPKNHVDLENEDTLFTAQLLTLAGARSVVSQQYGGLIDWRLNDLFSLMSHFLDEGLSICDSVFTCQTDSRMQEDARSTSGCAFRFVTHNTVVYGLPNVVLNSSV